MYFTIWNACVSERPCLPFGSNEIPMKYFPILILSLLATFSGFGQETIQLSNEFFTAVYPATWGSLEEKLALADRYETPLVQEEVIEVPVTANAKLEALKQYLAWHEDGAILQELEINGKPIFQVSKRSDRVYQFYYFGLSRNRIGLLKMTVKTSNYPRFESIYPSVLAKIRYLPQTPEKTLKQIVSEQELLTLCDTFPRRGINGLDYLIGGMLRGIVEVQIADGPLLRDFSDWQAWKKTSLLADSLLFTTFSAGLQQLCQDHFHLGDYKKLTITEPSPQVLAFAFTGPKKQGATLFWEYEGTNPFPLQKKIKIEKFLFDTDFVSPMQNGQQGYLSPFLLNDQIYQIKGRPLGIR